LQTQLPQQLVDRIHDLDGVGPGWRCTVRMMARGVVVQLAILSFCTLSKTAAERSSRRTACLCDTAIMSDDIHGFLECPLAMIVNACLTP